MKEGEQLELLDIYDRHRQLTGRLHRRGMPLAPGEHILVACVWVSDGHGRLLLTLRAPEKLVCPNLWENSGGAVLAGETSRQAIVRELREETGIQARESEFLLLETLDSGDAFYDHDFPTHPVALTESVPQPGETVAAQWASLPQVEEMIQAGLVAKPIAKQFRCHRPQLEQLVWQGGVAPAGQAAADDLR